jgi:hypothetical protein
MQRAVQVVAIMEGEEQESFRVIRCWRNRKDRERQNRTGEGMLALISWGL